jgi:hypothetical protein
LLPCDGGGGAVPLLARVSGTEALSTVICLVYYGMFLKFSHNVVMPHDSHWLKVVTLQPVCSSVWIAGISDHVQKNACLECRNVHLFVGIYDG